MTVQMISGGSPLSLFQESFLRVDYQVWSYSSSLNVLSYITSHERKNLYLNSEIIFYLSDCFVTFGLFFLIMALSAAYMLPMEAPAQWKWWTYSSPKGSTMSLCNFSLLPLPICLYCTTPLPGQLQIWILSLKLSLHFLEFYINEIVNMVTPLSYSLLIHTIIILTLIYIIADNNSFLFIIE